MIDDTHPRYHELVSRHLQLNREIWQTLAAAAPTHRIGFAYRAPSRAAAARLMDLLLDRTDFDVRVEAGPTRGRISVTGTTPPMRLSPERLDRWVEWMVAAGLTQDCEFEGWGTET